MLVLSRYVNETVVFEIGGERVVIKIIERCGNAIKLGIEAPKSVRVDRGEIDEAITATGVDYRTESQPVRIWDNCRRKP